MNKHVKILSFSIVETLALAAWLAILGVPGLAILALGLTVEHWMSHNTAKDKRLFNISGVPFLKIAGFSISETILWAVWLVLLNSLGFIYASILLSVYLIPQHKVELNVVENRPIFKNLLSKRTILISAIEGVGGSLWGVLALNAESLIMKIVAVLVLLAVMQWEHEFQSVEIQKEK